MHAGQEFVHVQHAGYRFYHQHALFAHLFEFGFVGACLQVMQDAVEGFALEIGRIGIADEVAAQGFVFEHHFFKAQVYCQPSAAHGVKQVFNFGRNGPKPVAEFGVKLLQVVFGCAIIEPGV